MFKIEQNQDATLKNPWKKPVFNTGITLAKQKTVKRTITYKEVTLMLGIIVAFIVALTIWATNHQEGSGTGAAILPYITTTSTSMTFVKTVLEVIF